MKKIVLSLLILFCVPWLALASGAGSGGESQYSPFKRSSFKIRHIPGERAIAPMVRWSPDGIGVECLVTDYKRKGFSYSYAVSPFFGKVGQTRFEQVKLGIRAQQILWDYRKNWFLSAFCTAYGGFENYHNKMLDKEGRNLFFSLGAGTELEYWINNKISVVSVFQQDYNLGSKIGDYTYSLNLGVRFKL